MAPAVLPRLTAEPWRKGSWQDFPSYVWSLMSPPCPEDLRLVQKEVYCWGCSLIYSVEWSILLTVGEGVSSCPHSPPVCTEQINTELLQKTWWRERRMGWRIWKLFRLSKSQIIHITMDKMNITLQKCCDDYIHISNISKVFPGTQWFPLWIWGMLNIQVISRQ